MKTAPAGTVLYYLSSRFLTLSMTFLPVSLADWAMRSTSLLSNLPSSPSTALPNPLSFSFSPASRAALTTSSPMRCRSSLSSLPSSPRRDFLAFLPSSSRTAYFAFTSSLVLIHFSVLSSFSSIFSLACLPAPTASSAFSATSSLTSSTFSATASLTSSIC